MNGYGVLFKEDKASYIGGIKNGLREGLGCTIEESWNGRATEIITTYESDKVDEYKLNDDVKKFKISIPFNVPVPKHENMVINSIKGNIENLDEEKLKQFVKEYDGLYEGYMKYGLELKQKIKEYWEEERKRNPTA